MEDLYYQITEPGKTETIDYYKEKWKAVRTMLTDIMEKIPSGIFSAKFEDGSWSASEIARHLSLSQGRFARVIPLVYRGRIGMNTNPGKPIDYMKIREYFKTNRKYKNPAGVSPEGAGDKKESLVFLKESMDLFEKNIEGKDLAGLQEKSLDHDIFGSLDLAGFIWVLILHEIHHGVLLQRKYK